MIVVFMTLETFWGDFNFISRIRFYLSEFRYIFLQPIGIDNLILGNIKQNTVGPNFPSRHLLV